MILAGRSFACRNGWLLTRLSIRAVKSMLNVLTGRCMAASRGYVGAGADAGKHDGLTTQVTC